MVKPEEKELYENALEVYLDIIRFQGKSSYLDNSQECLETLEHFEEFEKCQELIRILPQLKSKKY